MYKKEVPKLNKENFPTQKSLVQLHLARIGDGGIYYTKKTYVAIKIVPSIAQ